MGEVIEKTIKFVTTIRTLSEKPLVEGVYPMREWTCQVLMDDAQGNEITPPFIEKVIFKLHPTFTNPNKTVKKPPFKIIEEGWGEFEMHIALHYTDGGGSQTIAHDLNFQSGDRYEKPQKLTFKNPKPNLLRALQGVAPVAAKTEYDQGTPKNKRSADGTEKKSKKRRVVDIDKLADGLQKLGEDDLVQIVQIVNDGKTDDMYVRNDLEEGEFHIDLHTLSDQLLIDMQRFVDSVQR
ncbi:Transcription initiation factor TFIID subunit 14 [Taphrina deformans PYCC 5710]|uniref:Transcription initiation factor TFIID subunit 14 n=1 Tax=Taphrina deformans (strain PYCC 5710 / ATCC 11124 / CBS 356.35 / IMI 108563 / JCM 9778 / NBRC 8474) TaxID=1097556 RepID=R4X8T6_TAPDE|nr:Transcription initiation factor TFIID subunit 14 [Taphrina deformans PYCC 5710]|eukprot:CCG82063.1 Transcription initiation factor TFIID subunit 14 [Taphrina deformans PYCC 5710]